MGVLLWVMDDCYLSSRFRNREISTHLRIYNPSGGKTLLAMHGIGSNVEEAFDGLSKYLDSDCRVVAPDWLGFGDSSKLLGKQDNYGADYCSEWYHQLLKNATNAGILPERFSLFSVSMSGIPVAQTYRENQGRYDKMIFLNPAGLDKKIKRGYAFILSSGVLHPRIARLVMNDFVWGKLGWDPLKLEKLKRDFRNGGEGLEVLARYGHCGMTPFGNMRSTHFLLDRFAEIECPTLLIHSDNDEIFYEKGYLDFARGHGWEISELRDRKHSAIRKAPEEIARIINDFLG